MKGQGYSETTCSEVSTSGGVISHISGMHERMLVKSDNIFHYQIRMTLYDNLTVIGLEVKVTDNFSGGDIPTEGRRRPSCLN